jgi:hypothetical protein
MIDPLNPPTLPGAYQHELEEFLLFAIAVAGRRADATAVALETLLRRLPCHGSVRPFRQLQFFQLDNRPDGPDSAFLCGHVELGDLMKESGIGCYTQKARSFLEVANANLDLETCETGELEEIYGIGMKTSRFFILYTRPSVDNIAILDTHILKWMGKRGYEVPTQTPKSRRYLQLEYSFLEEAWLRNKTPRELDKIIWVGATR